MYSVNKIVKMLSVLNTGGSLSMVNYELARKMVDDIPFDWSDSTKRICDPHCGSGMFLLACAEKLAEHGHTPKHIVTKMLFGNDIDEVQVMTAKKALQMFCDVDSNIELKDSLNEVMNKKFNLTIGNPPFQAIKEDGSRKDNASNLWSEFAMWALEHSEQVALITPTTWLSPSADVGAKTRLWDEFNKYTTYANVTDVKQYFPKVGSSFGYVIVDTTGNDGLTFSNGESAELEFLPKSGLDEVKSQLDLEENIAKYYRRNQSNDAERRVAIPVTRNVSEENVQILEDGRNKPKHGSDNIHLWYYIYAGDDCEYVRDRVIECADILNIHCRWSGYINLKTVGLIYVG